MARTSDTPRDRVTAIVTGLPEGSTDAAGPHLHLLVRGRRFGYFLEDHHGDGRVAINCRTSDAIRLTLETVAPQQFHVPKYLGSKGWIGLWLDTPEVDWDLVRAALLEAYRLTAPKRLLARLEGGG